MGRTVSATQRAKFLKQLAKVPNVTLAARVAGFARRTAYEMKEADAEFAEAWEVAIADSVANLHAAVWDRAVNGLESYVVSMGTVVRDPKNPEKHLVERKFNDAIAMRLLQAHMPEYAPKVSAATGDDVPKELQPDPAPSPDEADAPEPIE